MANDDGNSYQFLDDDTAGVAAQVEKICKVYDSEDFFTVFVQMMLAFFALMSLWFKRQGERPKRKFKTWFLDVSKQGLGACYAHVLNMIIASILVKNGHGEQELNDQCAWYGIIYLVDTTLGLLLAIWGLKSIDWIANQYDWASLKHSGVYEGVDGLLHWIHQALAWLFILTVVKVIIYYFIVLTADALAMVGSVLFAPLQSNIRFELLFVMIVFPGLLNVIYFWVADHFLKAGAEHAGAHENETLDTELAQKAEGLMKDEEQVEGPKIWVNNSNESVPKDESERIINVI
ncbi:STIMATE family protein [Nitzschia inconspicua]|uniref:STIMATE family protein n=1 Tax=Nitzschia inconspicua TaxID=303405 RepID=A0A9K3KZ96_9STRA|nr:STIMATE family protein [Nitzschia inconspicua]KAG7366566.1 STIMATE family protein [Nitzschia inconspicua]